MPSFFAPSRATLSGDESHANERIQVIGLSIALAIFSLMVGIALLADVLSPLHISWLLALVPLILAVWYGYGFLQPNPQSGKVSTPDYGLLLSAAGWALITLSLLISQPAPPSANAGTSASSASDMTASFCGALALLCILCGAILSWRAWNETTRRNQSTESHE